MPSHDTPTDEQRIASLESDVQQLNINMRTLTSMMQRMNETIERLKPPHMKQRNCKFCGGILDSHSGRCMRGCRTKMGG